MLHDWHELLARDRTTAPAVDSRRRVRWLLAAMGGLLAAVFLRATALEATQGAAFRAEAAAALSRQKVVPGLRGRVLARDGTVLARDEKVFALAVHYRDLQEPPAPRWLRLAARARLAPRARRDATRLAVEVAWVRAERAARKRRLAGLVGLSLKAWDARAAAIQARVERIADSVNRRRRADRPERTAGEPEPGAESPEAQSGWSGLRRFALEALRATMEEPAPSRIVVAEELDYHVIAEGLTPTAVAEIESRPGEYPGVKIVETSRRSYPRGALAAHVIGYVGRGGERRGPAEEGPSASDRRGRSGVERTYDAWLRGHRGVAVETIDHSGRVLSTYRRREPGVGRDLVLTVDPALQATAEALLDAAQARRGIDPEAQSEAGGAALVMDVRNGALLAAASAPRFAPGAFASGDARGVERALADPARPLFDRTVQMAIPPGSVFKTVAAVALLQSVGFDPHAPYECRGYLHDPEHLRCQVFVERGAGHGHVTLLDALAQSCNTYFFHHASQLGAPRLVHWAASFGFGQATGIDLPGESAGHLPTPRSLPATSARPWREGDTQMLAIGQGALLVTPVQVARLMAAVANGGQLVTPHVGARLGLPEHRPAADSGAGGSIAADPLGHAPPRPIPGLEPWALEQVRRGLKRVVADHSGTAHGTVYLDAVEVAGKTGTAQTGVRGDHAWFAGYAPADRPRVAVVVVLEHGGSGSRAAGPLARRLVLRLNELGYFGPAAARRP